MTIEAKKSIALWSLVLLGIITSVLILMAVVTNTPSGIVDGVSLDDQKIGSDNPRAVIIEYSDFECPACGFYYPIIKQAQEDFSKDITFVFRHYPLDDLHKNARRAAQAAEAAGKQGKFWQMHDVLFEKQQEWSKNADASDVFIGYARSIGLDINKFSLDFASKDITDKINKDIQSGDKAGVTGTPTFFINGKRMELPKEYGEFKAQIEKEL